MSLIGYAMDDHKKPEKVKLTKEERQLALQLGFPEEVLKIVKAKLDPLTMGVIKKGGLEPEDTSFIGRRCSSLKPALSEKDRANYLKIALEYPELKEIVYNKLKRYETDLSADGAGAIAEHFQISRMGKAAFERLKTYQSAAEKYAPVVKQKMMDDSGIDWKERDETKTVLTFDIPCLDTDEDLEKALEELDKHCGELTLREENRAVAMLAIKYRRTAPGEDSRINDLKCQLKELGYKFKQEIGIRIAKRFDKEAEALKFLKDHGSLPHELTMVVQTPLTHEIAYPSSNTVAWMSNSRASAFGKELFDLAPGKKKKKLGPRQWLIERPYRCEAYTKLMVASITKIQTRKNSQAKKGRRGKNG